MSGRDKSCEEMLEERFSGAMDNLAVVLNGRVPGENDANDCGKKYIEGILCFQCPAWVPDDLGWTPYVVQVQLSWGGPADGFIVEVDDKYRFIRARYYYQDWGDYAEKFLSAGQTEMLEEVIGETLEMWIAENQGDLTEWLLEADKENDEEEDEEEIDDDDPYR